MLQYTPTVHFDRKGSLWAQFIKAFNFYRRYHHAANARKLRKVVEASSPDILYIWEITGIGVNSLLKVLPELHIPVVFHLGSYWFLYARSPETEQSRLRTRWLKRLLIGSVPELNWTSLIAVSTTVKEEYVRAGFDPKRIEVIYNGIDPRLLTLPCSTTNKEKRCHLLYVGRIRAEKGIMVMLKALNSLTRKQNDSAVANELNCIVPGNESHDDVVRLHIVGDGDQKYVSELKTYLKEQGLEELVVFHGKVPQDEVIQYYDCSQIMLVPSLWLEPFGMVVIEAMARGLPVIASNVGGPAEIIKHEQNGMLVDTGDERALAAAIRGLMLDPGKRQRLAEAARVTVQEQFVVDKTVSKVEQHLQRVLDS